MRGDGRTDSVGCGPSDSASCLFQPLTLLAPDRTAGLAFRIHPYPTRDRHASVSLLCRLVARPFVRFVPPGCFADVGAINPTGFQVGTEVEAKSRVPGSPTPKGCLFCCPGHVEVIELKAEGENAPSRRSSSSARIAAWASMPCGCVRPLGLATCGRSPWARCRRCRSRNRTTSSSRPPGRALRCTVSGVVQNEDVDHFVVEAKQGRPDHGRIGRHPTGIHVLRPLSGDSQRGAV